MTSAVNIWEFYLLLFWFTISTKKLSTNANLTNDEILGLYLQAKIALLDQVRKLSGVTTESLTN